MLFQSKVDWMLPEDRLGDSVRQELSNLNDPGIGEFWEELDNRKMKNYGVIVDRRLMKEVVEGGFNQGEKNSNWFGTGATVNVDQFADRWEEAVRNLDQMRKKATSYKSNKNEFDNQIAYTGQIPNSRYIAVVHVKDMEYFRIKQSYSVSIDGQEIISRFSYPMFEAPDVRKQFFV